MANALNKYSIYLFVGVALYAPTCAMYLLWTDQSTMSKYKISGSYDFSLSKNDNDLIITFDGKAYWMFSLLKIGNYPGY